MFSERLKKARKAKGISQKELALQLHISQQAYAKYETGKTSPNPETLARICLILEVSADTLLDIVKKESSFQSELVSLNPSFFPFMDENFTCFADVFKKIPDIKGSLAIERKEEYFCFHVKGNSMVGAGIQNNDIVFIRQQEKVEDGTIALVSIDENLILKRVYYDHEHSILKLFPENTVDRPMYYKKEELNQIQILGKAISVYSSLD